ncbi:hypothetical protein ACL1A6_13440, partial [Corynebacterium striatum]
PIKWAPVPKGEGMYTTITLAALAVLFVLIIQTIRRERPEDRMRVAAIGGGTSVAMILGAYILFTLAELPLILTALIASLALLGQWTGNFAAQLS